MMRSTPRSSTSGNDTPASTTRHVSPNESAMRFMPNSRRPPSATTSSVGPDRRRTVDRRAPGRGARQRTRSLHGAAGGSSTQAGRVCPSPALACARRRTRTSTARGTASRDLVSRRSRGHDRRPGRRLASDQAAGTVREEGGKPRNTIARKAAIRASANDHGRTLSGVEGFGRAASGRCRRRARTAAEVRGRRAGVRRRAGRSAFASVLRRCWNASAPADRRAS